MKKVAILLLLASPAFGATYSVTTTTAQETIITRARADDNTKACGSVGLQPGCTQAQADAAKPGAVTIYTTNGAYLLDVLKAAITAKYEIQKKTDLDTFQNRWAIATPAEKDAMCAALGLAAGCLP